MEAMASELRRARAARDASLEAVAAEAKISPAYLHKLEAGRVQNPSPRVLQRLSAALEVPYRRLMDLAGYLLPGAGEEDAAPSPRHEEGAMERDAPTNHEIVRLLEALREEVAALRAGQERLAAALEERPTRP